VLMCKRLLPEARRDIYLQGAFSFKLPKGHFTVTVHCSPHNAGAGDLAEELNGVWPGLLQIAGIESWADLSTCDHMLVYLNANTWTHEPEPLAAEIRQAMHMGLHVLLCHEFPSGLDMGSARGALEFKFIMDATPPDLKASPTNLYSQIAISLKGGELREPGLANLAGRLAVRVPRKPINALLPSHSDQRRPISAKRRISAKRLASSVKRLLPDGQWSLRSSRTQRLQHDVAVGSQHPGAGRSSPLVSGSGKSVLSLGRRTTQSPGSKTVRAATSQPSA